MANKSIGDYTAAGSIDASADYFLIQQSGVYKKINRNTILALASTPLGTSDIQSPTNKTFDNTNTYTIKDGSLTLQNTSSTTKQAIFSLASITAGQTRTITVPDASITLVGTAATQTLTNKTITSPTITGGTIDNSTVTVDSIAGHTVATTVTVANLQIANGVLNTANAVTATSIAVGAVQPQALVTGTGSGWAMQTWTPTFANFTKGNATITAVYIQIGKSVFYHLEVVLGNTSSMSTAPTFTLPVTATSRTTNFPLGSVILSHAASGSTNGIASWASTTTAKIIYWDTNNNGQNITSTAPFTWTTTDSFSVNGTYEAA